MNNRLSKFVTLKLLPLLLSNRHNGSLINDAKQRLTVHHEKLIYYLNNELSLSPETIGFHENDISFYERNIIYDWVIAEHNYINELEIIQKKSEPVPDITLLCNTWNEQMCLIYKFK